MAGKAVTRVIHQDFDFKSFFGELPAQIPGRVPLRQVLGENPTFNVVRVAQFECQCLQPVFAPGGQHQPVSALRQSPAKCCAKAG